MPLTAPFAAELRAITLASRRRWPASSTSGRLAPSDGAAGARADWIQQLRRLSRMTPVRSAEAGQ